MVGMLIFLMFACLASAKLFRRRVLARRYDEIKPLPLAFALTCLFIANNVFGFAYLAWGKTFPTHWVEAFRIFYIYTFVAFALAGSVEARRLLRAKRSRQADDP
jgi:hypothetical protein